MMHISRNVYHFVSLFVDLQTWIVCHFYIFIDMSLIRIENDIGHFSEVEMWNFVSYLRQELIFHIRSLPRIAFVCFENVTSVTVWNNVLYNAYAFSRSHLIVFIAIYIQSGETFDLIWLYHIRRKPFQLDGVNYSLEYPLYVSL